ncbi:hypothetical protein [Herbiconiux daphne]|uniref:Uncharacterized protein n=1 Tax=Herbiconiux daphne TaxID=2970914 RepID=A0ABT2H9I9_9MICO|nr:hypothetical protein [Herbiconiux daphne]MCS5736618.1 hypothetical protein [Herbiconiux daphne]
MNLKVLTNDLQSHLSGGLFQYRRKNSSLSDDDDKLLDDIIGWNTPRIAPVFNRVGFYLLDNKTAWYEFQMPSGRFVGIKYGKEWFDFQLSIHEADENPVGEEEWVMVKHLIKKGVLKWDKRWRDESYRRERKRQHIDSMKYVAQVKKRIRTKVEEKRKGG